MMFSLRRPPSISRISASLHDNQVLFVPGLLLLVLISMLGSLVISSLEANAAEWLIDPIQAPGPGKQRYR